MSLRPLLTVTIAVGLALSTTAGARPHPDRPDDSGSAAPVPEITDAPRRPLSPEDAAREIQRRHGGRVLAVQPDGAGFRVRLLKNGEVRIYQINP